MIIITQRTATVRKSGFLASLIPNAKERKTVLLFLLISVFIIMFGAYFIWQNHQTLLQWNFRRYKGLFKQIGSLSEYGVFAVFAIYPIFLILKWKKLRAPEWSRVKGWLQVLGKYVRKWHVPVALISTALVLLHGSLAILRGFKFDFTYFSGIVSFIGLIPLLLMGFKRFRRNDRKWHFKLAIVFMILFLIHSTFT